MASPSGREYEVVSAGAVVLGRGGEVLLVHRPKYDDWSFPKGKLDRGEHATAAAVREVEEETGLRVRLGVPLTDQRYPVKAGTKLVHYWVGRAVGKADVSGYAPNAEIDGVRWVPIRDVRAVLSYERDAQLLDALDDGADETTPVVVLRHAEAESRKRFEGPDDKRPLAKGGRREARRLIPCLTAYAAVRAVASEAVRCAATLRPYARSAGLTVERESVFGEAADDPEGAQARLQELVAPGDSLVVCSHRPVLPALIRQLGVDTSPLQPAAFIVAHRRPDGTLASFERHRV